MLVRCHGAGGAQTQVVEKQRSRLKGKINK
jgi:hypothetical protein